MVGSVIKSGGQPVQKNFQTKWSDKLEGGRIQAQFMLNSWGNYTYMSNQFVTVDTRSAYDCDSSLGTCTVRIRAGSPTNDGVWSMKGGAGVRRRALRQAHHGAYGGSVRSSPMAPPTPTTKQWR